ncbi:MAG: hypothetical protein ABI554_10415 [Flavobacterium sp.]
MRYLNVFLVLFLMVSCQKTNDYYSDINNSDNERIKVEGFEMLDLSVSAIKTNKSLVLSLYFIFLDESLKLEDFNMQVIGLEKTNLITKECYMLNGGETVTFDTFKEIKNHINETQEKFIIYFEIKDPKILNIDDLNFKVFIKSNFGTLNKSLVMKKHSRYRFFLEGA